MKTFVPKINKLKKWYIVDATKKTLGRLATEIAKILKGKHKLEYIDHIDNGDYIIVLNAEKINVTGKKYKNKIYYHHSGYIGGIKKSSFAELINKKPEKIIKLAVKGMLPKNSLGRLMQKKLKIYKGNKHNHNAQKPKILNI